MGWGGVGWSEGEGGVACGGMGWDWGGMGRGDGWGSDE